MVYSIFVCVFEEEIAGIFRKSPLLAPFLYRFRKGETDLLVVRDFYLSKEQQAEIQQWLPEYEEVVQVSCISPQAIAQSGALNAAYILPAEWELKYFKYLAMTNQICLGLYVVHERGDTPYDRCSWIFDYVEWSTNKYPEIVCTLTGLDYDAKPRYRLFLNSIDRVVHKKRDPLDELAYWLDTETPSELFYRFEDLDWEKYKL